MPSRWFVEIPGLDPSRVRLEFVHGAVSAWFDSDAEEHAANEKPYVVSPPTTYGDHVGVQISTVTADAEARLADAVRARREVRLGNQIRRIGALQLLQTHTWAQLAESPAETTWRLKFLTPTTWRSGNRASPFPELSTILTELRQAWILFGPEPHPCHDAAWAGVWVSDLDLHSELLRVRLNGRDGVRRELTVPGVVGQVTLRCDDEATAASVAPMMRLAPYTGLGSFRRRGLGVVSVQGWRRREDDAA